MCVPQSWLDCPLNVKQYYLSVSLFDVNTFLLDAISKNKTERDYWYLTANLLNFHYAVLLNHVVLFVVSLFHFITRYNIVFYLSLMVFIILFCWKDLKAKLSGPWKAKTLLPLCYAIMNKGQTNSNTLVKNYRKTKFCFNIRIMWFGATYKVSLTVLFWIIHKYVTLLSVKRGNEEKYSWKIWWIFQLKQIAIFIKIISEF